MSDEPTDKAAPADPAPHWTRHSAWMRHVNATHASWDGEKITSLVLGPDPNAPPGEPLSTEPLPPVDRRHLAMAAGSRLVGRDRPSRS